MLSSLSEREAGPYGYFCRIIGCDDQRHYLAEIISLDEKLRALGNYVCFDKTIPVTTDSALIEQIRRLCEQVPLKDFYNGALLNVLETQGYFSVTSDIRFNRKVKDAFGIMLNLYMINERSTNLNIVVNFVTKILLWLVDYSKKITQKSLYSPKLIYWGSPKTHEIYFLILMFLIGCDILVLNTSFNDRFDQVDKQNKFSLLIKKAKEMPIGTFPPKEFGENLQTKIALPKSIPSEQEKPGGNPREIQPDSLLNEPIIVVKLKRAEAIMEEILVPLNKRNGYVGEPYPIVSTYFVRYIGVPGSADDWEAEYYNSLYNLDKALQTAACYLKFCEGIPAPSTAESALIPQKLISYPYKDQLEILEQILRANLFHRTNDELLDNTVKRSFVDTVNLFAEKSSSINTTLVLNFALKLVAWLNRYLPKLSANGKGEQKRGAEVFNHEHNPKILFYGMIKPHEIYLLYAFHKIGCDVLFVHSAEEGDKAFRHLDQDNILTQLIRNKHNLPLASFPETELLIRKSTIAYNASKEIEEIIYSEDVGLFKPWQFESYSTQPITLKTTYDELKILWREPAKLRPEFKVQNKKVYVPNLFAKINGVSENLDTYWQDLKAFSLAPNTKLIEDVPFVKIGYTRQELYQTNYLLNEQGFLDELKVMKSRHYKFGYLKGHLQHFLIVKINELLCSGMFRATVDEKFKLKIIMTILTIDDTLLKLIEVFDYPQDIPKVIVYDNQKETFTENEAILLAYFNLIGLDVVIFTPTNYQTIEQQLCPNLLDVHQLPLVKYDLALPSLSNISAGLPPKSGLLSRFFNLR
jgi:hypothetical protein